MKELRPAILFFAAFTIICGGIYPAVVTSIASLAFPKKAAGSFITDKGNRVIGSSLIGQPFSEAGYFWPRPSATSDFGYNAAASGGSNSGPTNPDYLKAVAGRLQALKESGVTAPIPSDLVQASGSGVDPHISPEAAAVQVERVAKMRGLPAEQVQKVMDAHTAGRQFGVLGDPRVNVLELNLALDAMTRRLPGSPE